MIAMFCSSKHFDRKTFRAKARPNAPFPSCPKPLYQSEAWLTAIRMKAGHEDSPSKKKLTLRWPILCAEPATIAKQITEQKKKICLAFVKRICCLNCWNFTVHLFEFASVFEFEPELKKAKCVSEFNRKGLVRCFVQFRATLHLTKACVRKRSKAMLK